MLNSDRYLVTGGAGFLGRYVVAALRDRGIPQDHILSPRRVHYDLTREEAVARLYEDAKPTVVIHLAAEVGGIGANAAHPGRFFYANMAMGMHLVEHARRAGIRKFVHTGTVCAYPKFAPVPFRECDLWDGYPEETNAPYGVAKKALFTMLDGYHREYGLASAVVVPSNLYGPGDNFDPQTSHVIPAMIRRFCEARDTGAESVLCWGSGRVSREFLYVSDAAEAIVLAAERIDTPSPINLGTGSEVSIADLARLVADACGYTGRIAWDTSKPDGQPRRRLDTSRAERLLDWRAATSFADGLAATVRWYETSSLIRIPA